MALTHARADENPAAGSALSAKITPWLETYRVPAAGVAVVTNGRVQWTGSLGEREKGIPATPETIFNVASLTKPVFAMIALQLVARKELDLDDSLAPYWVDPDIADDARHRLLTPRLILSHQTGFPNWRRGKLKFEFDPGQKYQYSGEGFEYLKAAIEKKTQRTMADLGEELVFRPAGMRDTAFTWTEQLEKRFAVGYNKAGQPYKIPKRTNASAADDLLTTTADYGRFLAWVLDGAGLPSELFAEMQKPQVKNSHEFNFGLGWQLMEADGYKFLTHGGADEGVRAEALLWPARKSAVAILTNSDESDPFIGRVIEETFEAKLRIAIGNALWTMLEQLPPAELEGGLSRAAVSPGIADKVFQGIEARFLEPSKLDAAEKTALRSAARRFIVAMVRGTVKKEVVEEMFAPFFIRTKEGARVNTNITEEIWRTPFARAKIEADHAKVGEE